MGEPLTPYQYELVWRLMQEPMTANELVTVAGIRAHGSSPRSVAQSLRALVARGWIARDEAGAYRATERAREAVSW
jgi:hypothetical protein